MAANFDFISPVGWQRLFDKEKANGLCKMRVPSADYNRPCYYNTAGLIAWLIRNHRYSLAEIRDRFYDPPPSAPRVTQHFIAG